MTNNPDMAKSVAIMVYYKDPTQVCVNRCVLSVRVRVLEGKGNFGIGFKLVNPQNQYAAVFTIGKKTNELKLIRFNNRVSVLSKVVLSDALLGWATIRIILQDESITISVNKAAVIKNFKDSNINKTQGTYMFGTNRLIAAFSEIKSTSLMSEAFLELQKAKNAPPPAADMKIASVDVAMGGSSVDGGVEADLEREKEKNRQTNSGTTKEETIEFKCLKTHSRQNRADWCKVEQPKEVIFFQDISMNKCVYQFCEICCTIQSKDTYPCVQECRDTTTTEDPLDLFDVCQNQEDGENNFVKQKACSNCCESRKHVFISKQDVQLCQSKCWLKFRKLDGINELHSNSLMVNSYDIDI